MKVVENEYVTLRHIQDKNYLYHTVHKPVDEAAFKASLDKGVALMGQHRIQKWLSDDRLNGPLSQDFSAWAIEDWIPRAIKAGWKYWANVVPVEIEAAGTLTPFMDVLHSMGLRMMVFSKLEDAQDWLLKQ
ncbi:MAG: hypothetical protein JNJ61_04405 [Anaerolineae bacterium]|nr:hypothetical protein [Anaerolineae bacterium]